MYGLYKGRPATGRPLFGQERVIDKRPGQERVRNFQGEAAVMERMQSLESFGDGSDRLAQAGGESDPDPGLA